MSFLLCNDTVILQIIIQQQQVNIPLSLEEQIKLHFCPYQVKEGLSSSKASVSSVLKKSLFLVFILNFKLSHECGNSSKLIKYLVQSSCPLTEKHPRLHYLNPNQEGLQIFLVEKQSGSNPRSSRAKKNLDTQMISLFQTLKNLKSHERKRKSSL